jgi:hypothetical protein
MSWTDLAVFRRCGRCTQWLPIACFNDLERFCLDCRGWKPRKPIDSSCGYRRLSLTAKGRAYLASLAADE